MSTEVLLDFSTTIMAKTRRKLQEKITWFEEANKQHNDNATQTIVTSLRTSF